MIRQRVDRRSDARPSGLRVLAPARRGDATDIALAVNFPRSYCCASMAERQWESLPADQGCSAELVILALDTTGEYGGIALGLDGAPTGTNASGCNFCVRWGGCERCFDRTAR